MSAAIIESLRETIETAISRSEAAAALFGALGRWGARIPSDQRELTGFVHGPLKEELSNRMQTVPLARLIRALDEVLATAAAPTADREIPIEIEVPPTWRDEVSTKAMRAIAGPVPVLVLAASTALALRLRLALGESEMDIEARSERQAVERALASEPVLAIVDATDPTAIPVEVLADLLVHAPKTTAIVWGSESPYAARLIGAAGTRGVEVAGVATTEGVGPVFDLVISHRA